VAAEHEVSVDEVSVDNVVIKVGKKKGDGFMCDIAAVEFDATVGKEKLRKNYIAKYAPCQGPRAELLKQGPMLQIFKTF
jgi:hypothetical protein